jgi:hypothetical protein
MRRIIGLWRRVASVQDAVAWWVKLLRGDLVASRAEAYPQPDVRAAGRKHDMGYRIRMWPVLWCTEG